MLFGEHETNSMFIWIISRETINPKNAFIETNDRAYVQKKLSISPRRIRLSADATFVGRKLRYKPVRFHAKRIDFIKRQIAI